MEQFAAAARIVRKKFPDAVFQLAGSFEEGTSGISRTDVEAWVGVGDIRYLGDVSDVRPVLARSSVIVLPSYYREGIPRSLLEGLATGRALITTDMPGCRETVLSGQNGLLIPPQNAHALAAAMMTLCTQPKSVEAFGRRSRAYAEERFDVHRVNRQIVDVLESVAVDAH